MHPPEKTELVDPRPFHRTAATAFAVVLGAALMLYALALPASAATRTFTGLGLTGNGQGYLLVSSAGEFYAYGNARAQQNATGSSGIVSVDVTANGQGALAVSGTGQFYAYGTAHPWTNITGSSPIVGLAITADGQGALAVSRTGQFYAYGTAHPWTNITGSSPIVGLAITADGQGALAVSDSGQFYAYGTAHAWTNPTGFTNRITSVTMTADGQGAVAMSDRGQFYAYGTARPQTNPTGFTGSMVGVKLTADGRGLTAMSTTGQIYAYGTSAWLGNGDPGAATPDTAQLARQILDLQAAGKVRFDDYSTNRTRDVADRALASQQMQDISAGRPAHLSTRCFAAGKTPAPVTPDLREMQFLADLGQQKGFGLSTLFGQCHSVGSLHYMGRAADLSCGLDVATADAIGAKYGVKRNSETCAQNGHWHYSVGGV